MIIALTFLGMIATCLAACLLIVRGRLRADRLRPCRPVPMLMADPRQCLAFSKRPSGSTCRVINNPRSKASIERSHRRIEDSVSRMDAELSRTLPPLTREDHV